MKNLFEELGFTAGTDTADGEYDEAEIYDGPEYPDSTYMVVSKVAYLIGVPRSIFENEHASPKMEWYEKLEQNKNARIVRNLCILRTALERGYKKINHEMMYELKNLHTLPEYIPPEALKALEKDGITVYKANCKINRYLMDINALIQNRVNNVKDIFPIWLEWSYIRDLFIMPNGTTEAGIKRAAAEYYANMDRCPYQMYINWSCTASGNILISDKRFVSLLYQEHEDYFWDVSKITDAGQMTKDSIYRFLEESEKTNLVVDCENCDPYRLYAMLNNLNGEALLSKISRITLYDDVHTASAWDILNEFTQIPIEHIEAERLLEQKSQVDARLIAGTVRAYYRDNVDSFILASSDSDYWGMISEVPDARFLVAVESENVSSSLKEKLENGGYTYCYLNDFCTGNSTELKKAAILKEVRRELDKLVKFNINDIYEVACTNTRADLTAAEQRRFFERYLKPMKLKIQPDGAVAVALGE